MVNSTVSDRGPEKGWFNNKMRRRKMDLGEGAVKKKVFLSLSRPRKQNENIGHEIRIARMSFRACDSPLSPAESEIRDGRTGVKKKNIRKERVLCSRGICSEQTRRMM